MLEHLGERGREYIDYQYITAAAHEILARAIPESESAILSKHGHRTTAEKFTPVNEVPRDVAEAYPEGTKFLVVDSWDLTREDEKIIKDARIRVHGHRENTFRLMA